MFGWFGACVCVCDCWKIEREGRKEGDMFCGGCGRERDYGRFYDAIYICMIYLFCRLHELLLFMCFAL